MIDIDNGVEVLKNLVLLKKLIERYNATSISAGEKYTFVHSDELFTYDELANMDIDYKDMLIEYQSTSNLYHDIMNRYTGEGNAYEYCIKELANILNISVEKIYKESTFNYFWRGKYYSLPRKYYEYSIVD